LEQKEQSKSDGSSHGICLSLLIAANCKASDWAEDSRNGRSLPGGRSVCYVRLFDVRVF
jgi:hypothetical protein